MKKEGGDFPGSVEDCPGAETGPPGGLEGSNRGWKGNSARRGVGKSARTNILCCVRNPKGRLRREKQQVSTVVTEFTPSVSRSSAGKAISC